uniref:MFS transporter n=1 Tax=Roseihalotalea indica TaxID=2867963 RepID=A0AA49JJ35_9BACT|nr:MFS transporter [Tunicatimonas sp. TK19036]
MRSHQHTLLLLFTANGISGFAQGITMLAVPWYFAQQGLSSQFNLTYGIITFMTLLWGLTAGTIVDRFNRKQVFLLTNTVEGAILILVAGYGFFNGGLSSLLIIMVFATTVFGFYLHYPNLYAFAHEVSSESEYTKVTSSIEIVGQSTNVLAGAFAALLLEGLSWSPSFSLAGQTVSFSLTIEAWSMHEIFMMDGITYIISIILIGLIHYVPRHADTIERGAFLKRLKSGFRYLKQHPTVFRFGFFSHSIFVIMLVQLHALMPLYITQHLKAGGHVFGGVEVLYGLGALSAGIGVSRLFRKVDTIYSIIILMAITTGALLLSATTRSIGLFLCVGALIGFTNAGTRVLRLAYLFKYIPNEVIGRVNSIFSILNVSMRVFFIMLFSAHYFGVDSNVIFAYLILSLFTTFSALMLLSQTRRQSLV